MIYGFITSLILPNIFYNKLSISFLNHQNKNVEIENLKNEFDRTKDLKGMIQVLRRIFSFERFAFMSNQVDSF